MAKAKGAGGRKPAAGTFIQRSRSIGAAQKADWHENTGAGKSHVRRPFFDLMDSELDEIEAKIEAHVNLAIQRAS